MRAVRLASSSSRSGVNAAALPRRTTSSSSSSSFFVFFHVRCVHFVKFSSSPNRPRSGRLRRGSGALWSASKEGQGEDDDDDLEASKKLEPELDKTPRPPSPKGSLSKPNGLAASAAAFAADVKAGVSPEDAAAAALGAGRPRR